MKFEKYIALSEKKNFVVASWLARKLAMPVYTCARGHQEMTFTLLNGFCLLSKPTSPLFLKYIQHQSNWKKLNEKYIPLLPCISSFEGTSYKNFQDSCTSSFIYCCFISAFPSANMIFFTTFYNSNHHYLKKDFQNKFLFFNRFTPPPPQHTHPLNSQNPLSVRKVFCQCSLT